MLKEPVFKGLVSRVAASPFKQQLVLLQEDITRGCTQTPVPSAARLGPVHQTPQPQRHQQRTEKPEVICPESTRAHRML